MVGQIVVSGINNDDSRAIRNDNAPGEFRQIRHLRTTKAAVENSVSRERVTYIFPKADVGGASEKDGVHSRRIRAIRCFKCLNVALPTIGFGDGLRLRAGEPGGGQKNKQTEERGRTKDSMFHVFNVVILFPANFSER